MTRIRIFLIIAILWFAVLFNVERVSVNGQALNLDDAIYVITALTGVALLSFPNLGRQKLWVSTVAVYTGYIALHFLPLFEWHEGEFYVFFAEVLSPIITLVLMRSISHALLEFEMATEAFVLGADNLRTLPRTEGEEMVNHELYRARRFERPVAVIYCTIPESAVGDEETMVKTDIIPWRVTKTFKRRYQQVQLARGIASLTYKSDIIVEAGDGVVVCLPETNEEEARGFLKQLSIFMQETAQFDPMVGVACFPENGLTFEDLVKYAEAHVDEATAVIAEQAWSNADESDDHHKNGNGRGGDVLIDLAERLKLEQEASWVNKLAYQSASARAIYSVLKRATDIIIVTMVLLSVLPVFIVIAAMIYFDDRGPVFYRQWRTGYGGKRFKMFKFRTMYVNAKSIPPKVIQLPNGRVRYEWPEKIENDPRITRVGRFLRKTSLDELPQLINVLTGDMSLVGPRPTTWNLDMYTLHQTERLTVRPGITGLWQVSAREATNFDERLIWDMKYIDKMSLWLDAQIMWRTVAQVFKKGGV